MQLPAWMACKPRFDCRGAVRGIVVGDGVDIQLLGHLPLHCAQEAQKLLRCMLGMCFAYDFTRGPTECGKQRSGTMTEALAGRSLESAATQRQDGLCSFQRLTLAFFIQAKHHCILRRAHVRAHHIAHFVQKLRIGGKMKVHGGVAAARRLSISGQCCRERVPVYWPASECSNASRSWGAFPTSCAPLRPPAHR